MIFGQNENNEQIIQHDSKKKIISVNNKSIRNVIKVPNNSSGESLIRTPPALNIMTEEIQQKQTCVTDALTQDTRKVKNDVVSKPPLTKNNNIILNSNATCGYPREGETLQQSDSGFWRQQTTKTAKTSSLPFSPKENSIESHSNPSSPLRSSFIFHKYDGEHCDFRRELMVAESGSIKIDCDKVNGRPIRIGHGGNRGSAVYQVSYNGRIMALKMHGTLTQSEQIFIRSLHKYVIAAKDADVKESLKEQHKHADPYSLAATNALPKTDSCPKAKLMLDCIVFPQRLVRQDSIANPMLLTSKKSSDSKGQQSARLVGTLMERYDFSLLTLMSTPSAGNCTPSPLSLSEKRSKNDSDSDTRQSMTTTPEGAEESAFLSRRNYRRIESTRVITAILLQIVQGLVAIRNISHSIPPQCKRFVALNDKENYRNQSQDHQIETELEGGMEGEHDIISSLNELNDQQVHTTLQSQALSKRDKEFVGFTHQDIRSDNVLLNMDGSVALCDFELVGHLAPDGSLTTVVDRAREARIMPQSCHPPEGINKRGNTAWLLGLMVCSMYTGVMPLINTVVAFDDFGTGPFLEVGPNGIGWPQLKDHITRRVRTITDSSDANAIMLSAIARLESQKSEQQLSEVHYGSTEKIYASNKASQKKRIDQEIDDKNALTNEELMAIALWDFVGHCLCNDPDERIAVNQMLSHPIVKIFHLLYGDSPRDEVRKWIAEEFSEIPDVPKKI